VIIGECPYCREIETAACAPQCPAFSRETCESCGKQYWLYHSRLTPNRYSDEDFNRLFTVNHDTKTITPIPGTPPVGAAISAFPLDLGRINYDLDN
jgi:hypothetical protein